MLGAGPVRGNVSPCGRCQECIYYLYILPGGQRVSDRAKLFKSGGSQAVRLPKGYRFEDEEEVLIYRNGQRVILEPKRREWSREFLDLAGAAEDFPYPAEPPEIERGPDFDE